jgi:hypothetical protein
MPYRIAGIDVHKKMLAVAVADVEVDGDFHFERQKVSTTPIDLRRLADWLVEHEVDEVVMESTARGWVEAIAPGTQLDVQVTEPATKHRVSVAQLLRWCDGIAVSPNEILKKRKLMALSAGARS